MIVTPTGTPGSELVLRSMLYNRGYGSVEFRSVETLMTIGFSTEPALGATPLPAIGRAIVPPSAAGRDPRGPDADAATGGRQGPLRVPRQRRAVLEGKALSRRRWARPSSGW